jgi:hypothetical protein
VGAREGRGYSEHALHQPADSGGYGPNAAGELAEILKAGYPAAFGVFGAHRFHHTTLDDARCLDPAFVERLLPRFQAAMLKALGEA